MGQENASHPKNGTQRVVTDAADGSDHLQVFMNGSWMHDYRSVIISLRILYIHLVCP